MAIKHYKIRDKNTGLFSKGGIEAVRLPQHSFSKKGKVWTSIGALKNHLRQFCNTDWSAGRGPDGKYPYKCHIPEHWEVVEFEVNIEEAKRTPVHEIFQQ